MYLRQFNCNFFCQKFMLPKSVRDCITVLRMIWPDQEGNYGCIFVVPEFQFIYRIIVSPNYAQSTWFPVPLCITLAEGDEPSWRKHDFIHQREQRAKLSPPPFRYEPGTSLIDRRCNLAARPDPTAVEGAKVKVLVLFTKIVKEALFWLSGKSCYHRGGAAKAKQNPNACSCLCCISIVVKLISDEKWCFVNR